ncbi:MAG TPA: hypothetical protein VFT96_10625, partial [Gemmatimonadaceae bacterium]|nr:hypothetical protein [Gemmatimonadaceae bacterium]
LVEPNHTQAYTVGMQWLGKPVWAGRFRARGELANLEMSPTFRTRPAATWYTSRAAEQGYTHQGQVLGAAIGPGSSSQHVAIGYVADAWQLEGTIARIRWQNDVQAERINYPSGGWCEHDVSMMGGGRASVNSRFGSIALSYLTGTRYNPFFSPRQPSCPGKNIGDVRNGTFSLRFEPVLPRW